MRYGLIVAAFLLSACGFEPLHGKRAAGANGFTDSPGVAVEAIDAGHDGQLLRARLEDKLNPDGAVPAHPKYRLTASLGITTGAMAVARDGTVSRYNIYLVSAYTLTDIASNEVVAQGSLKQVGAYNNLPNEYFSTFMAERDAREKGINALSDIYAQRLSPYLSAQQAATPAQP